ncbi:MAG TPA: hypothetical protein VEX60_15665 [Pyrinomonadaceae bacterium]|nr:hypothetical protein [Pyrinomonadaceae bacterium]
MFAAVQLKRPTGVVPPRAVFAPNRGVIQRVLDEDFKHGGTPKMGETAACRAFAKKVSDFVDQAYNELISGNVKEWKGAKAATFLELLLNGHGTAKTHAANAIEERVYALMLKADMTLKWVPQFADAMGSASKPDIVIHLPSGNEALVDITSDRGHILGKAGGWTTSERYVYVAEAYFHSVREEHIANIKSAIEKGGIKLEDALELRKQADAARRKRLKALMEERRIVREGFREYGSFSNYALTEFSSLPKSQRMTAAARYLRANGIVVKGMRRAKGKRKPSLETLKKKKATARKVRAAKEKKSAEELLATLKTPKLTVPMKRSTRRAVVAKKKTATPVVIHKFLK